MYFVSNSNDVPGFLKGYKKWPKFFRDKKRTIPIEPDFNKVPPGKYYDPKKNGHFHNMLYIVFVGKNLDDCIFKRYHTATSTISTLIRTVTKKVGRGYLGPKGLASIKDPRDGPPPRTIVKLGKDTVIVPDAPGSPIVKFDLNFPVTQKINYLVTAQSKKTGKYLWKVWYTSVIEASGYGKATGFVKLVKSE